MNRVRPGYGMPPQIRLEILEIGSSVARRRRALNLTQAQLDFEAGFTAIRVVDKVERQTVDRRSLSPDHEYVRKITATLDRLEKDPEWQRKHGARTPHPRALRAKPRTPTRKSSQTLTAILKRCPEMDVWITQGGCDGIRKTHAICTARRFGLGCKGIAHRHFHRGRRIEKKEISVEYTPLKPEFESSTKLRREDWT